MRRKIQDAVRASGAMPATIAGLGGEARIGLDAGGLIGGGDDRHVTAHLA